MGKEKSPIIQKSAPDPELWSRIQKLSGGPASEKVQAVELIFKNYTVVPEEADDLLKELALPKNTRAVRITITKSLASKPKIPWVLHLRLLSILEKDKDKEVATIVEPLFKPYRNIQKSLEAYALQQSALINNILGPDYFKQITKQLEATQLFGRYYDSMLQRLAEPIVTFRSQFQDQILKSMPTFRLSQSMLDTISNLRAINTDVLGTLSMSSPSYFRVEEPVTVEKSENELGKRLREIPPGQKHWRSYQTACKDVLNYCLVPPLLDPTEESSTEGGHHRRDIIYPIAQGEGGFWGHIQNAYSALAVIVDAKNYTDELPANQVVITSKYFGPKKLGNFGLIISPKGPSESAKREQNNRWLHHGEIILCLGNSKLEQMIALKESGECPEIVLDKMIRELRQSL